MQLREILSHYAGGSVIYYVGKLRIQKGKKTILMTEEEKEKVSGLILLLSDGTEIIEIYNNVIRKIRLSWKPKAIYPTIWEYLS